MSSLVVLSAYVLGLAVLAASAFGWGWMLGSQHERLKKDDLL